MYLTGYVKNKVMKIYDDGKFLGELTESEGSLFLLQCNKILGVGVTMTTKEEEINLNLKEKS